MDRPRRALLEEPEDDTVVVAPRRSSGSVGDVDDDDTAVRPARASARPRRALLSSPSTPASTETPAPVVVPEELFRPEPASPVGRRPLGPELPVDPPTFVPARRGMPASVPPPVPSASVTPGPSPAGADSVAPVAPVVVDRLVKSFDGVLALRNLSFTVQPGRVTGFLGPNGAGKTTTLRILVGLIRATTGTATFGGIAYTDLDQPQQTVGCVLDAAVHPGRTGRNHLRIQAATAGASDARVDELLELVGLTDVARTPTRRYSDGMRQRLALAAALLGDPDYLILDEPTNGLDPDGVRWLRRLLRDFAYAGRVVLVASHLLTEIQATADDIVVVKRGRLLAQLPLADLNLGAGTTVARVGDVAAARQALTGVAGAVEEGADERGRFLRVHSDEVAAVGAALFRAGVVVHELVTERRDLEQEFFTLLEESA